MSDEMSVNRTVGSHSGRNFSLKFLFFQNGSFLIIYEEQERIGALSVSISSSNKVTTAKVIPSKFDSMFVNTLSEKISSMINGICLVSLYTKSQLGLDDMKAIMGEVMSIVSEKGNIKERGQDDGNKQGQGEFSKIG